MSNGSRYERQLVKLFGDTDGWMAQRAAASGSATDAELPDITFAHDGSGFAGELKTTSEPYIHIGEDEIGKLQAYAGTYGMQAVAIGRFKGERAFYIWAPDDMERTDAGTYRGSPDDGQWAAKIAEPDGSADGIDPSELTSFHLTHGLSGKLGKGITEPPANTGGSADV